MKMDNVLWGILFVIVNFALFLICYRLFGMYGLYAWVAAATILANIQVVKTIELFGIVSTLGNTMYGTIYLATDLVNEKHGRQEATRVVWFGFFTLIMTIIIMQMAIAFTPQETDIAQASFETIFGLMPWVALGSLTAYVCSQYFDVRIFALIKRAFPSPGKLWLRSAGSTLISQMIDSVIFCSIAFGSLVYSGEYTWTVWFEILLTTYVIKFLISLAATPVIYLARGMKEVELRKAQE
jgi:uncharacterized integral membrane protein (TIGR00697 family)